MAPGARKIDQGHCNFRLRIGRSKIHRWGIFTEELIPPNRKVIEYTGEKISRVETKRRAQGRLNYLFTLDSYWCIDGSVGGSGAEYINHSCTPNIEARIFKGHILYMSLCRILPNEELTVDYNFPARVDLVRCRCGSPQCRGTINVK